MTDIEKEAERIADELCPPDGWIGWIKGDKDFYDAHTQVQWEISYHTALTALKQRDARRNSFCNEIYHVLVSRGFHATKEEGSADLIGNVAAALDSIKQREDEVARLRKVLKTLHKDCCYQLSDDLAHFHPDRPSAKTFALVEAALSNNQQGEH